MSYYLAFVAHEYKLHHVKITLLVICSKLVMLKYVVHNMFCVCAILCALQMHDVHMSQKM